MKKKFFAAAVLFLLFATIFQAVSEAAGRRERGSSGDGSQTMTFGGRERTYLVRVPDSVVGRREVPLLLVLHGGGRRQDGEEIEDITQFTPLAKREGFIVVYPNAVEHNWNDGRDYADYISQRENIDDVGFLLAVVDEVSRKFPVDKNRVYVTGASNGGMMSYRMACDASTKIAAVAPVIANIPENIISRCRPSRAVPVLATNGTEDPMMPYQGGFVKALNRDAGRVVSTRESIRFWAKNNECRPDPRVVVFPDIHPDDGSTVRQEQYEGCQADTTLLSVEHGGHTWAKLEGRSGIGLRRLITSRIMGIQNTDYDASKTIWEFLAKQRLR